MDVNRYQSLYRLIFIESLGNYVSLKIYCNPMRIWNKHYQYFNNRISVDVIIFIEGLQEIKQASHNFSVTQACDSFQI